MSVHIWRIPSWAGACRILGHLRLRSFWIVKTLQFSVKYLLSVFFLGFKVLLISFEHCKSRMRFAAFSTAEADPHDVDGLIWESMGLRLAPRSFMEFQYKVVLATSTASLKRYSGFQKAASICMGISWQWMVSVMVGVWIQLPPRVGAHFVTTLVKVFGLCLVSCLVVPNQMP